MKIKIGYRTYNLIYGKPDDEKDETNLGSIGFATEEDEKSTIFVRDNIHPSEEGETILHEILHGCLYEIGHYEHDEAMIAGVAHMLFHTLKNKVLINKIWSLE